MNKEKIFYIQAVGKRFKGTIIGLANKTPTFLFFLCDGLIALKKQTAIVLTASHIVGDFKNSTDEKTLITL